MFDTLLIANRGEISRRIIRTCRARGIRSVAVYSDADADADFVRDADVAVALGGTAPADSYLRIDAIIEAAVRTGAQAVHPGYGFLSENAAFARAVADAGLTFIGPSPDVIDQMGSKVEAKRLMAAAGVPLLPSAEIDGFDDAAIVAAGAEIGYPVLVKASAGGGGRGMRIVPDEGQLLDAVAGATREASSAFGDGTVYLERYVAPSRHVEVQIFGDGHGAVVHFGERECSIQRRHQKIVEEAPSPSLDDDQRAALHDAAVTAGRAIGYTNAGTVEFLLAPTGEFFFLEVNTRLQVEHPVTEAVFGIDLVGLQFDVAAGGQVPTQETIGDPAGHAIEVRLYAEDPLHDFLPSTGPVHAFVVPGPVRVDTAIDVSGEVSQHYDPMIAKVIAHGADRSEAARVLAASLEQTVVAGIHHNAALLARILRHPEFLAGDADTGFLERHDPAVLGTSGVEGDSRSRALAAAAIAAQASDEPLLTTVSPGFRNVHTTPQQVGFDVDGETVTIGYAFDRGVLDGLWADGAPLGTVVLHHADPISVSFAIDGLREHFDVRWYGDDVWVTSSRGTIGARRLPRFVDPHDEVDPGSLIASMPGTIRAVEVAVGDSVTTGDVLVVMEAMKMELAMRAVEDGVVAEVNVAESDAVEAGTVLVVISPHDS